MKGIITKVLEIKALYENTPETLRPILFKTYGDGTWALRDRDGNGFVAYVDRISYYGMIIEGADPDRNTCCELEFVRNSKGEMVPTEYTVWNARYETYHRVF